MRLSWLIGRELKRMDMYYSVIRLKKRGARSGLMSERERMRVAREMRVCGKGGVVVGEMRRSWCGRPYPQERDQSATNSRTLELGSPKSQTPIPIGNPSRVKSRIQKCVLVCVIGCSGRCGVQCGREGQMRWEGRVRVRQQGTRKGGTEECGRKKRLRSMVD